ncbi:MAG: chloramphenicol acetyltransferase [Saprospiraceae bacterium]|nr:chloramphenicol acetyltransferase [Saprospiraceae bacterium]
MNYKVIDIENWKRKDQYEFFKSFDLPFFNVTANVNVTSFLTYTKNNKLPFFYCTLFAILKACNEIPEFRYRINENQVFDYQKINAGITILKDDNTFIYGSIDFKSNLHEFVIHAKEMVAHQKLNKAFLPHDTNDLIFVSAIPWVSFTGFVHARKTCESDSVPRFVIGKFFKEKDQLLLPISVEVHHALADGFHIGQFLEKIQLEFDSYS